MLRGKSTLWMKFSLFAASTLFALLAAELVLRCCWHNPYANEQPDRIVRLRLQHANAEHRIDRSEIDARKPIVSFRVDDRSYVRPSFQYENPDYTIAFLGGSTTECCAVDEDLRFPALVSSELAKLGIAATTLNAGTSGNTLHDSINNLLNHVVQDDPDIVVLMHACNDIGLLSQSGNYDPRSGQDVSWATVARSAAMKLTNHSHLLGITRQVMREHTHYVPTDPSDLHARPIVAPSPQIDGAYEKRLRAFIRLARALDVEPVVMTQPISSSFTHLTPDWTDQDMQVRFNDIVRRVGRQENVLVIDLVNYLQCHVPDWNQHMHVFYDGIHVTDEGSRIYGRYISQVFSERLRQSRSQPTQPLNLAVGRGHFVNHEEKATHR